MEMFGSDSLAWVATSSAGNSVAWFALGSRVRLAMIPHMLLRKGKMVDAVQRIPMRNVCVVGLMGMDTCSH